MLKIRNLAVSTFVASLSLLYASAPAQAELDYKVSWIGNTFGKENSNKWVQNNIAALYVAPDGTCYTNSGWDEGHHEGGIYKNGDLIGAIADLHENHWYGGAAVAGDEGYLYVANGDQLRRHNLDGSRSSWSSGGSSVLEITVGGEILGLAVDKTNKLIYSADRDNGAGVDGEIRVYNATTMAFVRSWAVPNPGRIAVASDGSVWVAQRKSATAAGQVLHYSSTGNLLTQKIVGGAANPSFDPTALCFDGTGRLLVADNGRDQQLKIYTNLGATAPTQSATFGAKEGIFGGVAGQVAPLKFNGLTGVGVDSSGNIYVGQNRFGPEVSNSAGAGSILDSYTATGTRNWQLLGLEFVDCAGDTPGTDGTEVYTKYARYSLDFSKTAPGSEWKYVGHTLNQFKYPDDTRYQHRTDNFDFSTGFVVRMIGGKKFQFNYSMWGYRLEVYRFNAATDGEVAIPCGQIDGDSIWRDLDGDGAKDQGETTSGSGVPSGGGISSYWVDAKGDLWQTYGGGWNGSGGVRQFKVQGLDSKGSPIWNFSNVTNVPNPGPFTDLVRIDYVQETDTMYLAGYAEGIDPEHHWNGRDYNEKTIGSVIARFDNWSTGNRTPRWVQVLPDYNEWPSGMSVAGDFVFVTYDGGSYQEDSGHTRVRRASDGVDLGRMWAGPYNIGRLDIEAGVRALKRANGEYIIFTEDDWYARVMMYRWTPSTTVPAPPTLTAVAGNCYAKLTWPTSSNASVYIVKRGTNSAGPFTTLTTMEGAQWTDTNNAAGLTNGTSYYYVVQAVGPAGDSPNSAAVLVTPSGRYRLRIDSGSWSNLGDWIGDTFVTGGSDNGAVADYDTTGLANAAPPEVYNTVRRRGNEDIIYTLPGQTAGLVYTVRLHFGEWWYDQWRESRKLNVTVNGTQVITNLDVYVAAGGNWRPYVHDVPGITPNSSGQIVITISSPIEPMISGLELIPPNVVGGNIPNGTYKIVNRNSGKVLDVSGVSTADGAHVHQWTYVGGNNQKWTFEFLSNEVYRISAVHSGKFMDIEGGSVADGAANIQWPWHGGDNQKWRLVPVPGGYYNIVNLKSGKLLDISGASLANGARDIQWYSNGGSNQQWQIIAP